MDSSSVELEAPLVAVDMISDSDEVNPELQGDTVAELGSGITFEVIGIVDPTAQVLDNSDGRENASKNLVTWADGSKWSYITYEKDGQIKLIPEKSDESEAQISLETEEAQSDAVLFDDNQQETSEVEGQVILLEDGQLALFKHHGLASTDMVQIDDNFTTLYTVAEEGENGGTTLIAVEGGRTEEQAVEPKTKKKTKWLPCPAPGCTRSYSSIHHLKVHIRTHTGARPYVCTFEGCPKAFATDYSLKTHIRTHTGEKPFSCTNESCSKAFKTSGDLQKHIRTHTGERPFVCPFQGCNRSFTTSTIRKGHIRTHTGERPFVCSHSGCFRAFASSTNYKNHMRIHSGEKPYACKVPDCHRRFTEYSSLHKHQLVHTQYRHHRCHFCDRAYRQAATLTAHKRVVHGAITTKDGTEIILEQMISGDSNRNFQSLTNDLLNLKREGTFVAVDRNEDTSLFIVSQANDDHELEFGDGEEDNSL